MTHGVAIGLVAVVWLSTAMLSMLWNLRRGRALADALEARHPELYEALGRPRPRLLESVRGKRFARFVGRREFEALDDPALVAAFEAHRLREIRLVVGLVLAGAVIAVASALL